MRDVDRIQNKDNPFDGVQVYDSFQLYILIFLLLFNQITYAMAQ